MAMALKADVARACRMEGTGKPVDLVHLSTMTMGDRDLEMEVLGVFLDQSRHYLASYRGARDAAARKRAAHSLKGAARSIGAWELSELAARAEQPRFGKADALAEEVSRVCCYIRELRQAN